MSVKVPLSGEFCHWKVAAPYPEEGEVVRTADPLMQRDWGDATIVGAAGKVVTVEVAVLEHPDVALLAVQVYMVTVAVAVLAYTVATLAIAT